MRLYSARIIDNKIVTEKYLELTFTWPEDLQCPEPGQFVTVRASQSTDPLLRRPFAVASFDLTSGHGSIVYETRGKATGALAVCAAGDSIDILGPLGNSFPVPPKDVLPILLAGGIGLGPIRYFARSLFADGRKPECIIGARTASLLPTKALDADSFNVTWCTDDGTAKGEKGNVVDVMSKRYGDRLSQAVIYACGPNPMMKAAAETAAIHGARCWVSMEQVMGCGVGACMGCTIRVQSPPGFARVCTEGPVFDATEVIF